MAPKQVLPFVALFAFIALSPVNAQTSIPLDADYTVTSMSSLHYYGFTSVEFGVWGTDMQQASGLTSLSMNVQGALLNEEDNWHWPPTYFRGRMLASLSSPTGGGALLIQGPIEGDLYDGPRPLISTFDVLSGSGRFKNAKASGTLTWGNSPIITIRGTATGVAPIPEPSSLILLGASAMAGLLSLARRRLAI